MDIGGVSWYGPVKDLVDFGGVCLDTMHRDMMAEKVQFKKVELTFLGVTVQFSFVKRL